jgi:CheY-like chemotaxis protein
MDISQKGGNPWLSAVLGHIRDGVIGIDRLGHVTWMNSVAERLTDRPFSLIEGKGLDALFDPPQPPGMDALLTAMENVSAHGPQPIHFSYDHRGAQVDFTVVPVMDGDECVGAIVVFVEHGVGKKAEVAGSPKASAASPRQRIGRVLVMDDDEVVRTLTVQKLLRLGYESEGASSGEEAVSKFRAAKEAGDEFDVVVLDLIVRGGMGGRDTIELLRKIDPNVRAVLTSGHAADPVLTNFWEYGFSGVVRKPFVIKELEVVIREAMEI